MDKYWQKKPKKGNFWLNLIGIDSNVEITLQIKEIFNLFNFEPTFHVKFNQIKVNSFEFLEIHSNSLQFIQIRSNLSQIIRIHRKTSIRPQIFFSFPLTFPVKSTINKNINTALTKASGLASPSLVVPPLWNIRTLTINFSVQMPGCQLSYNKLSILTLIWDFLVSSNWYEWFDYLLWVANYIHW